MSELFPEMIRALPEADIPISGLKAYLSQADNHQIIFWEFHEDAEIPEHCHESHWSVVLEGKIDLIIPQFLHAQVVQISQSLSSAQ